jgi:hypothetical protein
VTKARDVASQLDLIFDRKLNQLRMADAIGVTIPDALQLRAYEVISRCVG